MYLQTVYLEKLYITGFLRNVLQMANFKIDFFRKIQKIDFFGLFKITCKQIKIFC